MKIIELIRLIRKHFVLLLLSAVCMASVVTLLTRNPKLSYVSKTTLYTGLATAPSVEMDKTYNYALTNTAYDNLINIIKSRETQQEVAIRLLSQHLMLKEPDPKFISKKSFEELRQITPDYIRDYIAHSISPVVPAPDTTQLKKDKRKENIPVKKAAPADSLGTYRSGLFPSSINRADYERTVVNLTRLMNSSDTNFVYKLLNFEHPHYSIAAIAGVKAERINTSDLVRLSFEIDDPGICQQTLAIYTEVFINNFKNIKENRSDAVVKYFEAQLSQADDKLKDAEDNLLEFNKSNNIINYYEQSKAVAVVKEDMEVDYNNKKAQLAGMEAAIRKLEDKLNIQQLVQLKSSAVMEKKQRLSELNYLIAEAEADENKGGNLAKLQTEAGSLKEDIRKSVGELYTYQNTTEGVPVTKVLNDWITNVVEADNMRAKLRVMDQRNKEFQQQYSIYAPAGAHMKRIEREIAVSEQGYLEILHGLNLAKLKLQDNELSSNLKTVDPPYYPLSPMANKRKVMIIAGGLIGGLIVLGFVLVLEYFDESLRNLKHAGKVLHLKSVGIIPKMYLRAETTDFNGVINRLLDQTIQNIDQAISSNEKQQQVKTILLFSMLGKEGKTMLAGNLARRLREQGKKVMLLNSSSYTSMNGRSRFPILSRLLGYRDPRIDHNSPFLASPETYLDPSSIHSFKLNEAYYTAANAENLLRQSQIELPAGTEYLLIEMPAILSHNYSPELVKNADLALLVARANRVWSEADQNALNSLLPMTGDRMRFILNGSELKEVEAVLGDLPKRRNIFRKKLKNLLRFQFFSNNKI